MAHFAGTVAHMDQTSSAEAWFAGGRRIGYSPKAHAIVAAQDASLRVFLRREGNISHAVSFLPGFPDGSFGWSKVRPHLPNAAAMPKLFLDYVGMGDSDKPKDYVYSTAERTDLVEAIWRDSGIQSTTLVALDFSSLVVLEHLRRRIERSERGEALGGPDIRGVSSSMADSSRMGTHTRGTRRPCCVGSLAAPGAEWDARLACSRGCQESERCDPKAIA
jgi:pimeloyl-ACP methyl ester carboxylesterase